MKVCAVWEEWIVGENYLGIMYVCGGGERALAGREKTGKTRANEEGIMLIV